MTVDYLIIGQGICGTWLSYYLLKEKKTVVVIDSYNPASASQVASGLINPVTGRRVVTTWMADALLPFAQKEYTALGDLLKTSVISKKNIIVFPGAPDLQQAFTMRMQEQNGYIHPVEISKESLNTVFNFPFDVFEISPCYLVDMPTILNTWRQYLSEKNLLWDEVFNENEMSLQAGSIQYKNIHAKKIIYANGIQSFESKYWKALPFVLNKGQALTVEINDLNDAYVYKFGHLTISSLQKNKWWAGSSNELAFRDALPTDEFRNKTLKALQSVIKKEIKLIARQAGLRPATVERRPFVGTHPLYNQLAIINGMGSKGCSLAPWFAKQLILNLINNEPLDALADVSRFSNMLKRNTPGN
jgi:glycine/D-amino acid oxidase-like deaminating enzyme